MAGLVLAVVALAELAGRLWLQPGEAARLGVVTAGSVSVPTVLLLCLLCVAATVPVRVALAGPGSAGPVSAVRSGAAAVVSCVACLLSLAVFDVLPVAAGVACALSAYLAGR